MLRISSVWRIRQIKFQNSLKNASILYLFFEICLALNSYKIFIISVIIFTSYIFSYIFTSNDFPTHVLASGRSLNTPSCSIWTTIFPIAVASEGPAETFFSCIFCCQFVKISCIGTATDNIDCSVFFSCYASISSIVSP